MNLIKKFNIPLIIWSSLAIFIGVLLALLMALILNFGAAVQLTAFEICVAAGLMAAAIGWVLGLPVWWIPVNFAVPLLAYFSLDSVIPAWMYLLCFVLLVLIYWNTAGDRVPLYLSNQTTWRALERLISDRSGPFLDLGCGLGGTLFYLARKYPDRHFVGIESAPLPFLFVKIKKTLSHQENVSVIYGDMWNLNFALYQTVYAFLSPAPMARLFAKITAEIDADGQFISNSFDVPDRHPDTTIVLDDRRKTQLLIWKF